MFSSKMNFVVEKSGSSVNSTFERKCIGVSGMVSSYGTNSSMAMAATVR